MALVASTSNASADSQTTIQPPAVWELLHEDLVIRLLSKLPFSSLVRFRTVCKRWNVLIISVGFSLLSQNISKCVPVYFNTWDGSFTVFNSVCNDWQRHSLAFLQAEVWANSPSLYESLSLVASAGGLLLFDTCIFGQFFVCNPITRKWRELRLPRKQGNGRENHMPAPPWIRKGRLHQDVISGRNLLVGMVVRQHEEKYNLVIAGLYKGSLWTTLVYDSRTFSWALGSRLPLGNSDSAYAGRSVCVNGYLYCLVRGDGRELNHYRVLKYDLDNQTWSQFWVPRHFGPFLELLEHQQELLLVVREPAKSPLGCNTFYKLQECRDEMWVVVLEDMATLIDEMKEPLGTKFMSGFHRCGHVGHDDMVFEVGFYREENDKGWRVLHYDNSKKTCCWLPDYEVDKRNVSWHGWTKFPLGFYSFQPSLRILV